VNAEEYVRIGWDRDLREVMFFFIAVLLIFLVLDAKKSKPVTGRLVSAGAVLLLAWIIDWQVMMPLFIVLISGGVAVDLWYERDKPLKVRRNGVLSQAVSGLAIAGLMGWMHWQDRVEYRLDQGSLTRYYRQFVTPVHRSGVRIIEFSGPDGRQWHIKDGDNNITVEDGQTFSGPGGARLEAEALVVRLEKWAGVKRELKPREALASR
jgi:hypothetical protein